MTYFYSLSGWSPSCSNSFSFRFSFCVRDHNRDTRRVPERRVSSSLFDRLINRSPQRSPCGTVHEPVPAFLIYFQGMQGRKCVYFNIANMPQHEIPYASPYPVLFNIFSFTPSSESPDSDAVTIHRNALDYTCKSPPPSVPV